MQTKNKGVEVSNQLKLETSFVPEIFKKQFSKNSKWNVGDKKVRTPYGSLSDLVLRLTSNGINI